MSDRSAPPGGAERRTGPLEGVWQQWKKGFDRWEASTAKVLDVVVRSPAFLEPAGAMLSSWMRAKKQADAAWARWWSTFGLPTRREQERLLHAVNQLQSRIMDLEEQLAATGTPEGDGPWK
ncbi:MAG: hypothetical protein KC635_13615 [Myxococcales bacterium]|nr:hypothetical protein [Myxococcales bacterium]MCB9734800.1 hypothetical protein [Deltaproteobacteria bacterium]